MHQCEHLQECIMNALLRVGNSDILLEFQINDAILFIHAHLSPLAFLNFVTVFSVRSTETLDKFSELYVYRTYANSR